MLSNIHINCMGTVSFSAKLGSMRKEQNFCVYPAGDLINEPLKIQSDKSSAYVNLSTGRVILFNGPYFNRSKKYKLLTFSQEVCSELLNAVLATNNKTPRNSAICETDNNPTFNILGV